MEPHNTTSFFANLDVTQATPLHWAVLRGDLGEVHALLAAVPGSLTVTDNHGWTALHWAAGAGHAECAAALVRAGASLEARGSEMHTPWMDKLAKILVFDSPASQAGLEEVASAGLVEVAQALREAMARPDAKATAGATPLHVAAGMGAVDCICCLLPLGAQLDAANGLGLTALHLTAACNHVPALQALVQAGADIHAGDGNNNTPLHVAAGLDSLECLQELIRLGAVVDARGDKGGTPLHFAAGQGATACVQELLAAGANVDACITCGVRPLHLAATGGMLEALRALIDAGADLHATDDHGGTALHHAAAAGSVDAGLALVSAGADLEAATTQPLESKTPIQVAAGLGHTAMASALAAAGADINRQSEYGITCLHLFLGSWGETHRRVVQHYCDMAEALLAAGCHPIKLCIPSRDKAALACAEATSGPDGIHPVDLPRWAGPHLREVVPLAASGMRWSPGTHRAFPPCFRAAATALLLANHRGWTAPQAVPCPDCDTDTDAGLPKGRERVTGCGAPAGTIARVHLPPEVVLLILEKASRPHTAWVPQLQPGVCEASASASSKLFDFIEWALTDLVGHLRPWKVGLGMVATAVGAAVVFRLRR
ncbi:hypothetical protein N2152v2_009446 [Parachlorella kessleri]